MWIAVLIGIAVLAAAYALVFRNAPEGWEDENGFHFGKPGANDKPV